eukprot:NODE_2501_length_2201_cov_7.165381.p1 GENE.NODE_2501_length_2201_cov_7.165381~~NODE_2501_length_2201_cov_7.165381.p1  ORF type:complete len:555 (-),score=205.66 NODE_2501_length_2201_cov_7.165381:413-2077(-)
MAKWPNWAEIEKLVRDERYMAGNSEFTTFKSKVLKATSEEIHAVAEYAPMMWDFLLGIAAKKPMYRRFLIQVFNRLTEVSSWVDAWTAQAHLHEKIKTLHEDLQAALAMQHEAIKQTISPSALKSMMLVRHDAQPEKVKQDMEKERMADEVRAESGATGQAFESNAMGPLQAFQEAVDAVVAIDDSAKMMTGGRNALDLLRIGCIQCAGNEQFFVQEIGHAHQVFSFLISYVARHRDGTKGTAEVFNQLFASPSWSDAFESSRPLRDTLCELAEDVQAALGAQNTKIMNLITPAARARAERGDIDETCKAVNLKMQSIRFTPSAQEVAETAPAVAEAAAAAAAAPAATQWKEAKTAEGHIYYYNTVARSSQWERPAELGGPHMYIPGDPVEVWSNSLKQWGKGRVDKVTGDMVTASFSLPNGSSATKDLRVGHKDLRPAVAAEGTAFTTDEQNQYLAWFERIEGGPLKPAVPVANFLVRSGLSRAVLKQIWNVANPGVKKELDFEEFSKCCRLVAHCQAMGPSDPVLEEADRPLRLRLRSECLNQWPPRMPVFP